MGYFFDFITYLLVMDSKINKDLAVVLKDIRNTLSEQVDSVAAGLPVEAPKPKAKPTKVVFDKSTGAPFEVIFSERGFAIEGTRMSFEELETAISKNYNIMLEGGKGLVLDAVKMQKILKYKDIQ
jgi:hypothetical protein